MAECVRNVRACAFAGGLRFKGGRWGAGTFKIHNKPLVEGEEKDTAARGRGKGSKCAHQQSRQGCAVTVAQVAGLHRRGSSIARATAGSRAAAAETPPPGRAPPGRAPPSGLAGARRYHRWNGKPNVRAMLPALLPVIAHVIQQGERARKNCRIL